VGQQRKDCVAKNRNEGTVSDPGKGSQTREQIVTQALHIAAYKGLGALTIGTLAEKLKMSKSGLFLHFGSKENLEAAVVERAGDLFFSQVLVPTEESDFAGIERVWALCEHWLDFVKDGILPGGYFFTGAFFLYARQEGPIPRQIEGITRRWLNALEETLDAARRVGDILTTVDARQAAYELNGLLMGAQCSYLMDHNDQMQARSVILNKLASLATDKIPARAFDSVRAWRKYLERRHE
jgi:AcrR family transcriptional regulator